MIVRAAVAQSLVDEGVRELEELRLRQLETVQLNANIAAFTTDGCSGGLSDSWALFARTFPEFQKQFGQTPPWQACCIAHDKVYWRGDALDGYAKRKQADLDLKRCVVAVGVESAPELSRKYKITEEKTRKSFNITAQLMYRAVRIGGQPCSLLPWRWGYGWANCAFASVNKIPDSYSNIKSDEHVTFFNTAGWLDADKKLWHIPIHGWIYEPEDSLLRKGVIATLLEVTYDLKVTPETEANFRRRINLMIADNERGKKIVIRLAGQDFKLPASKENGHFSQELTITAEAVNAFSQHGRLHYFAVTRPGDKRRYEGDVQLVDGNGISVISDIDDTVKVSNVTDHKHLFDNTFYKDFRAVSGMPGLYRHLAARDVVIHFVSSSPWQLYDPLRKFVQRAGFPWATFSLKTIRFRDQTFFNLFKKGTETKPKQIEPILKRFPKRQFILVGDNGEQDPEVYGDIARRYTTQIQKILIRNVDRSIATDERYKLAFKDIAGDRWLLFDDPKEIVIDGLLNE